MGPHILTELSSTRAARRDANMANKSVAGSSEAAAARSPPRRAIIRWYWANLTMAMGAIFALNAAALYVLHSGRAEKAPLPTTDDELLDA